METIHVTFDEMHQSMVLCTHLVHGPLSYIKTPGQTQLRARSNRQQSWRCYFNQCLMNTLNNLELMNQYLMLLRLMLKLSHQVLTTRKLQRNPFKKTPNHSRWSSYSHNLVTGEIGSAQSSSREMLMPAENPTRDELQISDVDDGTNVVFLRTSSFSKSGGIFINQAKYALETLKKYGMDLYDPVDSHNGGSSELDEDSSGIQLTNSI
ncbi:hypothetical protein Tco_0591092 [Tanacetum coccineum]